MHYVLLAIGILIGLYALAKFFANANKRQIVGLFLGAVTLSIAIALFYMAVTGRLAAAMGLFAALWPVGSAILRLVKETRKESHDHIFEEFRRKTPGDAPLTQKEALEVLGLPEGAKKEEVLSAYKRLIRKVHPDQEGSKWLAAKLNEARDVLLKD